MVTDAEGHTHGELSCRRRDGSLFPAWARQAPVLDARGEVSHHVLTSSDIS